MATTNLSTQKRNFNGEIQVHIYVREGLQNQGHYYILIKWQGKNSTFSNNDYRKFIFLQSPSI